MTAPDVKIRTAERESVFVLDSTTRTTRRYRATDAPSRDDAAGRRASWLSYDGVSARGMTRRLTDGLRDTC